jgi:predicted amidohydrolase
MIVAPAAFNMTTGPAHWDLLFRQRAVDNQCFTVGAATARDSRAEYVSWGNSIVVGPWGSVVWHADEKEVVQVVDVDLGEVERVRRQLPLLAARRTDVYAIGPASK